MNQDIIKYIIMYYVLGYMSTYMLYVILINIYTTSYYELEYLTYKYLQNLFVNNTIKNGQNFSICLFIRFLTNPKIAVFSRRSVDHVYFVLKTSKLAGCFVFIGVPLWRPFWLKRLPRNETSSKSGTVRCFSDGNMFFLFKTNFNQF